MKKTCELDGWYSELDRFYKAGFDAALQGEQDDGDSGASSAHGAHSHYHDGVLSPWRRCKALYQWAAALVYTHEVTDCSRFFNFLFFSFLEISPLLSLVVECDWVSCQALGLLHPASSVPSSFSFSFLFFFLFLHFLGKRSIWWRRSYSAMKMQMIFQKFLAGDANSIHFTTLLLLLLCSSSRFQSVEFKTVHEGCCFVNFWST